MSMKIKMDATCDLVRWRGNLKCGDVVLYAQCVNVRPLVCSFQKYSGKVSASIRYRGRTRSHELIVRLTSLLPPRSSIEVGSRREHSQRSPGGERVQMDPLRQAIIRYLNAIDRWMCWGDGKTTIDEFVKYEHEMDTARELLDELLESAKAMEVISAD